MQYDHVPEEYARNAAQTTLARFRKQTAALPRSPFGRLRWLRRKAAEQQLLSLLPQAARYALNIDSIDPLTVYLNYGCVFLARCFHHPYRSLSDFILNDLLPSALTYEELQEVGKWYATAAVKECFADTPTFIQDHDIGVRPPALGIAKAA